MTALAGHPEVETAADWLAARCGGPAPCASVFVHAPSHVFQAPGGGENQLVQTGRHLERLGLSVRPFVPWTDRLDRARVLHLFGMSREGVELARTARAKGVPVVLSTICWYDPRSLAALAGSARAVAWALSGWAARRAVPGLPGWRRTLLGLADAVLPNSAAEADQLVKLFGVDPAKVRVVPNGVDVRFASESDPTFSDAPSEKSFVLYVGRVEPRKNVLGLIGAARRAGLPLTVIGDAPPGRERYLDDCRRAGGGFVRWQGAVGHDDPRLVSAYRAARVVALPSWFETPGLAALEGALAGAAVVVTPYGCAREYFGDRVGYARPDRPREVVAALRRAWDGGPDPGLASHVAERFLWSRVARDTAEVYDQVAG